MRLVPGNARLKRNLELLRQLGEPDSESWPLHFDVKRPRVDVRMAA